jgi:autoinducer 2-degrading protein
MVIAHVNVRVIPDCIDSFRDATIENARHSVQEPGVIRFEVLQNKSDPTHFLLIEEFRTLEAAQQHKDTPHYLVWRAAVENMMAEPRATIQFRRIFPKDAAS